jgi:hypothetical protein
MMKRISPIENKLATRTMATKKELNAKRKQWMLEIHQQKSTRHLFDEDDLREELKEEIENQRSALSYIKRRRVMLTEDAKDKLHRARDQRVLNLPNLEERQSQDFSAEAARAEPKECEQIRTSPQSA